MHFHHGVGCVPGSLIVFRQQSAACGNFRKLFGGEHSALLSPRNATEEQQLHEYRKYCPHNLLSSQAQNVGGKRFLQAH
jgi:hypothetical protein